MTLTDTFETSIPEGELYIRGHKGPVINAYNMTLTGMFTHGLLYTYYRAHGSWPFD